MVWIRGFSFEDVQWEPYGRRGYDPLGRKVYPIMWFRNMLMMNSWHNIHGFEGWFLDTHLFEFKVGWRSWRMSLPDLEGIIWMTHIVLFNPPYEPQPRRCTRIQHHSRRLAWDGSRTEYQFKAHKQIAIARENITNSMREIALKSWDRFTIERSPAWFAACDEAART